MRKLTLDEFKDRFFAKYPDSSYTFDRAVYINAHTKMIVTCPDHGDFEIRPNSLLNGSGCAKCAGMYQYSTEEWIEEFFAKFPDSTLTFSRAVYVTTLTKMIVTCSIHGDFEIRPGHLLQGRGCAKCMRDKFRSSIDEFKDKFFAKFPDSSYTFERAVYVQTHTKIIVTCPEHGDFEITPNNLLHGQGCAKCANYGFNPAIPAVLYYARVDHNGQIFYKIGITNRSFRERYSNADLSKMTLIDFFTFETGTEALEWEQFYKSEFADKLYQGDEIILESAPGNAELFTENIL